MGAVASLLGKNQAAIMGGMGNPTAPVVKDLVLLGGGHSHAIVLKSLSMKGIPGVNVTLITRDVHTPYSGMLPGYVAGHYTYDECHIDLRPLAEFAGVTLVHCPATGLDVNAQTVALADENRPPIRYDVLSIDIGITPVAAPGAAGLTVAVKPIDSFTARWERLRRGVVAATAQAAAGLARESASPATFHIVVVGGGAGGVELMLAMHHRLTRDVAQAVENSSEMCDPSLPSPSGGRSASSPLLQQPWQQQQQAQKEAKGSSRRARVGESEPRSPLPLSLSFMIVTRGPLLPTHNSSARKMINRVLRERGIQVVEQGVREVLPPLEDRYEREDEGDVCLRQEKGKGQSLPGREGGVLVLESGAHMAFDACVWCTQGGAAAWLGATGLALDAHGFIRVNDYLQSVSYANVFAAGDIHSSDSHPRPKAGVFAVRQGMPLADNLRRALLQQPLKPFLPQTNFLSLISTGDNYCIATRGGWALEGTYLWWLKDYIDRSFMRKFSDLPEMNGQGNSSSNSSRSSSVDNGVAREGADALAHIASTAMRCGGCGSKVGSSVLSRALDRLFRRSMSTATGPDAAASKQLQVLVGLDAPDDAAVLELLPVPLPSASGQEEDKMVMVQTVDFFRAIVRDPYDFGRIAANHALGDCYAMGADPATALAMATVPLAAEEIMEETLFQMLAGAASVLDAAGCALVGGHTSEGDGMALGFTVTGTAAAKQLLRKGGMQAGNVLILTKPIGTGTLMAASMRCKAKGRWVDAALECMLQSSKEAADILKQHGATAATDVTGFGLLGHLVEMAKASHRIRVELDLPAIPILEGAEECVEKGIFSSLYPSNFRLKRAVTNFSSLQQNDPRVSLLFDPQTAGGLLASVPAQASEGCILALHAAGYAAAAVIGSVHVRVESSTARTEGDAHAHDGRGAPSKPAMFEDAGLVTIVDSRKDAGRETPSSWSKIGTRGYTDEMEGRTGDTQCEALRKRMSRGRGDPREG